MTKTGKRRWRSRAEWFTAESLVVIAGVLIWRGCLLTCGSLGRRSNAISKWTKFRRASGGTFDHRTYKWLMKSGPRAVSHT
jgi:hypothetical protein